MKVKEFERIALSFFPREILDYLNDGTQYGFNNLINRRVERIGYSVNLTEDIILQARDKKIDLIITHHNIWEDHFELREDCLELLNEYRIIHFFNHLPLDSVPFGTSYTLMKKLELEKVADISHMDFLTFGVVGKYQKPITLDELQEKLAKIITHKVQVWQNNDKRIETVGIVAGSGSDLESLHEAYQFGCDAYITGEKKLKTLLYAKHVKMNFLLGSHTFTEISGLSNYLNLIKEQIEDCEVIKLCDETIEIGVNDE